MKNLMMLFCMTALMVGCAKTPEQKEQDLKNGKTACYHLGESIYRCILPEDNVTCYLYKGGVETRRAGLSCLRNKER